ncbi:MAG TPA: hypothetical protein VK988_07285 [Acidimicrobiales bacterium]|nr:hypothetical protein [Acidimicrobiales bacterium]
MDLVTAIQFVASQICQVSNKRWQLDIAADLVQTGRVSDVERWYTRFLDQFITYWRLRSSAVDPGWTAVTAYYCAFFGAQTFLSMLGLGARTMPALGLLPSGLYQISEAASPYSGHVRLNLHRRASGAHRALWRQLSVVLDTLISLPGNDLTATHVLQSWRQIIIGPPGLSEMRNEVNYSIEFSPREFGAWSTEFSACHSVTQLERRLEVTVPSHPAQRFELVALGAASLSMALYDDYLDRGTRLDLRPSLQRREKISRAGEEHPARSWFR